MSPSASPPCTRTALGVNDVHGGTARLLLVFLPVRWGSGLSPSAWAASTLICRTLSLAFRKTKFNEVVVLCLLF